MQADYDDYAPTDHDGDPKWIHVDEYQDALGDIQHLKDVIKDELIDLKEAILSGNLKRIDEALEEIYGYLED